MDVSLDRPQGRHLERGCECCEKAELCVHGGPLGAWCLM